MFIQGGKLDEILEKTIASMDVSKKEIFNIAETTRSEVERIQKMLEAVKQEAEETINLVDETELKFKWSRVHLMEVSRDFNRYSEQDIKMAYEEAQRLQTTLAVLREREKGVRQRREELMHMLKQMEQGLERADSLAAQINTVIEYLYGNLTGISNQVEDVQQRQSSGLKIIKAREEERKRVAREIHDGPAQTLANVVLRAEICEKLLDTSMEGVREELSQLKKTVRGSLVDIRKIIYNLRPMILDDLGLVPALRRLVRDYEEKHGLHIEFLFSGTECRLHSALEVAVFRIVQECLNNTIKHANAENAQVRLTFGEDNALLLDISDDGIGFDVGAQLKTVKAEHYGLRGMKERTQLLEGELVVESEIGVGTRIQVRIPIVGVEVKCCD